MRERKFRAWQIDHMVYFTLQDLYWRGEATGEYDFPKGLPVMQYTSLKDKNSKEIYEGDILIWHSYKGVIKYSDIHARFDWGDDPLVSGYATRGEVIGNIHESPELLEER